MQLRLLLVIGSVCTVMLCCDGGPVARYKRQDSNTVVNISFSIVAAGSGDSDCLGGARAGLHSTGVRLEYRDLSDGGSREWVRPSERIIELGSGPVNLQISGFSCVQIRAIQEEHGGGLCNCWRISNVRISARNINNVNIGSAVTRSNCNGSASVPRTVQFDLPVGCSIGLLSEPLEKPFNTSCPASSPHIEFSFSLRFLANNGIGCSTVNEFNGGVEFSILLDDDITWIPLIFVFRDTGATNTSAIIIGNKEDLIIRGYRLKLNEQINVTNNGLNTVTGILCDFPANSSIQFRWLQTSNFRANPSPRDVWSLDNVRISSHMANETEHILLEDSFDDDQLNVTNWPQGGLRSGDVSDFCTAPTPDGLPNQALVFGRNSINISGIASRSVKTASLSLPHVCTDSPSVVFPISFSDTESFATTDSSTSPAPALRSLEAEAAVAAAEEATLNLILSDPELSVLLAEDTMPAEALGMFQGFLRRRSNEPLVNTYLLASIINRTSSASELQEEAVLDVGNEIIEQARISNIRPTSEEPNIAGSSLLNTLDQFVFNNFPEDVDTSLTMAAIGLQARTVLRDTESAQPVVAIDTATLPDFGSPRMSIELPQELIGMFTDDQNSPQVRLRSFVYSNLSGLLPEALPGENDTELASGVVSTALQCGSGRCPTENLNLTESIRITIEHSKMIQSQIEADNTSEVVCVFVDMLTEGNGRLLSAGDLSTRGCSRNDLLSNSSVTVCECNHLTHFAILLSASPPDFSPQVTLSLEIIGYVGVTISLVAMTLTVLTFIALKSLHNMRNFIHINLCVSLGIAQLIFVVGVDRTGSEDSSVPIHCQVIAVLLHYFFLVSFMWMLMEGVVLYVALVQVFVKNKKHYLLAFTLASYGLPLLYLGLLTLPLGFALNQEDHYGYKTVCFLNPETSFIWAFIAPVILIFLANVGFFVMALTIMCRHKKRKKNTENTKEAKHWLKVIASLVVIMGLTWILGVLIVEVEELVPLAYIYTILVAFQGVFIFVIFVVFSKSVREAYGKWWKVKVNESAFLSKHFGEKLSNTTGSMGSSPHLKQHKKTMLHSNNSEKKFDPTPSTSQGQSATLLNSTESVKKLDLSLFNDSQEEHGNLDSKEEHIQLNNNGTLNHTGTPEREHLANGAVHTGHSSDSTSL